MLRPRIAELIAQGARGPLTLVSAPAGTGKTSAVASWAAGKVDRRVAWISVDAAVDAGPLWALMMESLARAGVAPPEVVRAFAAGPAGHRLAAMVLAVGQSPEPATLVLDCAVELPVQVVSGLHELLAAGAGRLHLILLTRADPALPLHLYRLNEAIVEIRCADLAFDRAEVEELLGRAGVELAPQLLDELLARTSGWAAGLAMVTRTLTGGDDPQRVIHHLEGASGEIAAYLRAQVLDLQPPDARDLMLRTSVVPQVEPGLAEVLAGPKASRRLADLLHGNAFLEQVHDPPGGFRYHPLFRELLVAEFERQAPADARRLRLVAADWHAARGEFEAAVRLQVAAGGWQQAAQTVVDQLLVGEWLLSAHPGDVSELLGRLPATDSGVPAGLVRAALALARGDYSSCRAHLEAVRQPVASGSSLSATLVAGALEAVCLARSFGAPGRILSAAGRVRALLSDPRAQAHPELTVLVEDAAAQALLYQGQLVEAAEACTAATSAPVDGFEAEYVRCLARLAFLEAWFGHSRRAIQLARRAKAAAEAAGAPGGVRTGVADLAMAWAYVETRDLRAAAVHAAAAERAGVDTASAFDDAVVQAATSIVRSRIARMRRDLPLARAELERARADASGAWMSEQIVVEQATLDLLGGRLHTALALPELRTSPARESAALLRAEARLLADGASARAAELPEAKNGSLTVRVQSLLIEALDATQHGEEAQCGEALESALRLAAPEHLRRVFSEAPEPVRRALTLRSDVAGRHGWLFLRRPMPVTSARSEPAPETPEPRAAALAEPLTEKELEVLGRLAQLLTTEETAESMFISVNTVRTHVRSILRKLGVRRRNEAIRRARDLGLLPPIEPGEPEPGFPTFPAHQDSAS